MIILIISLCNVKEKASALSPEALSREDACPSSYPATLAALLARKRNTDME
jgi:hypothetical protein